MGDMIRLLIVDDDQAIRTFFANAFAEEEQFAVECASSGDEALDRLARTPFDVVVTDLCMPRMDGIRLIEKIRKRIPVPTVVAITGIGTIKDAVSLMKTGAHDVLTKPFSLDEIRLAIDKAVRHHRLARRNRELEHKLKTTEKLAAIGKLAAGVAHEINNPLDAVIRFVKLALDQLPEGEPTHEYLKDARGGLDRIAGIVKSLLDFSRSIVIESAPMPIGDLVRQACAPYRDTTIQVSLNLQDASDSVPGEYLHVVSNLVKNAADEMPGGGRVTIASRRTPDGLELTVADDGPGIAESIRDKIFEPFFTTKKMGNGTGLGLSICQQIIEKQGGRISVTSESGRGTTFRIEVPLRPAGQGGPADRDRDSAPGPGAHRPGPPAPRKSRAGDAVEVAEGPPESGADPSREHGDARRSRAKP
jgi:signal transduction histidine kinase